MSRNEARHAAASTRKAPPLRLKAIRLLCYPAATPGPTCGIWPMLTSILAAQPARARRALRVLARPGLARHPVRSAKREICLLHNACVLYALDWAYSRAMAWRKFDIGYPCSGTTGQAVLFTLAVKAYRHWTKHRGAHIVQCVYADYRVEVIIDSTGHQRDRAAAGADVEIGGPGCKCVARDQCPVPHVNFQCTGCTSGPHAAVLCTERATAGPCRNLCRVRGPVEHESDVAAMTTSAKQHGRRLLAVRIQRST